MISNNYILKKCCKKVFWGLFCMTAVGLFSCSRSSPEDQVLARINGEVITVKDFSREFHAHFSGLDFDGPYVPDKEKYNQVKKEILEGMIQSELLLQEAKGQKIIIDEVALKHHVASVRKEYSQSEFQKLLRDQRLSEAQWIELERARIMLGQVYQKEVGEKIEISDEAVQAYYDAHVNEFQLPEQIRIRQIRVATEAQAHEIHGKLGKKNAPTFGEMAKKFSLAPEAENEGDVGFYARNGMPEVFDAAFDLQMGKYSRVIESDYGFHIFKLEERKPARLQTVEEVKNIIISKLQQQQEVQLFEQWKKNLYAKARIVRNESLLREIN